VDELEAESASGLRPQQPVRRRKNNTWYCAAVDQLASFCGSEMCFLRPWAPKAPSPTAVAPKMAPVFHRRLLLIVSSLRSVLFCSALGRRGDVSSVAIQLRRATVSGNGIRVSRPSLTMRMRSK
jgi:hypothetical protein